MAAKLLKDLYDRAYIARLAAAIADVHPAFDQRAFVNAVQDEAWSVRELKARMTHITCSLHKHIRLPYRETLQVLQKACPAFGGYHGMFFPDYVQQYGVQQCDDWQDSMDALAYFTRFSSSEFAVRPFIEQEPVRMMAQMQAWASYPDEHVRRLASEGCRPRLPWAPQLISLIHNPDPVFPVLEQLRADTSLYVRKSVANHLNDIAKDHPQCVLAFARRWRGTHPHTDWILKRGCRTLLKQGDPTVLAILDYPSVDHVEVVDFSCSERVVSGQTLVMQVALRSSRGTLGLLRIEYSIDFVRSGHKSGHKVFHWSEKHHQGCELSLKKQQLVAPLSTRKLYPGRHTLSLRVNGQLLAQTDFDVVME